MSITAKILIFVGSMLALGMMGFIIYNQINLSRQQQAIQQQVVQQRALVDGLVQSANSYTTKKDLDNFIQQNTNDLKAIQSNLNSLGAAITAANTVTANSQGQVANNLPSTSTGITNPILPGFTSISCPNGGSVNCPNTDPFGYQHTQQKFALDEQFSSVKVPIGSVSFSAWQQNPWGVDVLPRQYNATAVVGTDENQRVYVDNKLTVKVADKTYTIPITTAKTEQVFPSSKFSFWSPQLFGAFDAGVSLNKIQGELTPSINFGFINYGKFRNQPDFSFAQVGVGYGSISHQAMFNFTPVAYNLGNALPLIHNTYLAPSIHVGTDGSVLGMAGLRLAF